MFRRIKQRIADAATLAELCRLAEAHARRDGQPEPGAKHFLLAALDLPEGSARRAFERAGADPDAIEGAIARQYDEALNRIGLDPNVMALEPAPLTSSPPAIYAAAPTGQVLIQGLAKDHRTDRKQALLGAHIVAAIAVAPHGVAVRALRLMGVDLEALRQAARAETEAGAVAV